MSRRIVQLTLSQSAGMLVTSAGSAAIWLLVARIAQPTQIGALGQIVSGGALAAGLVSAGLGQFLLLMVNRVKVQRFRQLLWLCLGIGTICSGIAGLVLGILQGVGLGHVIALALLAAGVAITNLQDAVYLGMRSAYQLPAKALALVAARVLLLFALTLIDQGATWLVVAFVSTQLLIGIIWAWLHIPPILRRAHPIETAQPESPKPWRSLGMSYLYTSAVTAVVSGVPLFVTGAIPASAAGHFYITWTLSGLLGSVAVAAANAVLASAVGLRIGRLLAVLLAVLLSGALLLAFVVPPILAWFNPTYTGVGTLLAIMAVGQVSMGMVLGLLAACRIRETGYSLTAMLALWPTLVLGAVVCGVNYNHAQGAAAGFALGNLLATFPLIWLTFTKRGPLSLHQQTLEVAR